jgi:hypothetical protein
MIKIAADIALVRLTEDCKFLDERARRILNIAWEFGNKAEPCPGGYVHVFYHGQAGKRMPSINEPLWSVVEHLGPVTRKWGNEVAISHGMAYTEGKRSITTHRKGKTMPPRRTQRNAPPPPPEPEANGSTSKLDQVQKYLTKNITPTLQDYAEWFEQNVADPTTLDVDRLIALAVTFYGEFQASDFNRDQKAARKAERERATADGQDEPEPATATRARRGTRTAAAPAPAKPAGRSRGARAAKPATSGAAVY